MRYPHKWTGDMSTPACISLAIQIAVVLTCAAVAWLVVG